MGSWMKRVFLAERLWLTRLLWCSMLDDAAMDFEVRALLLNLKDASPKPVQNTKRW